MAEVRYQEGFKKAAVFMNCSMLLIHILFLIVFHLLKATIMVYANIGSIIWYIGCFWLLKKNKNELFVYLLLTEIWIHLSLATFTCGWNCGFALYNLGMMSIVFYTNYIFLVAGERKNVYMPIVVTSISVTVFLLLKMYSDIHPTPLYLIKPIYVHAFYYLNTVFVFLFTALFLLLYAKNVAQRESTLHEIADYDELTELFNRHRMRDVLSTVYDHAEQGETNFCTTIIDIDDFKIVNDTYGHEAGDYILKEVSAIMQRICKGMPNAYVGRWGGEEFLIVQEYEREKEQGLVTCINTVKNIHDTIREFDFVYQDHHIQITVTAGIAAHPEGKSIAATIRIADERLYKGKLNGKDCVALS